MTDSRGLLIFDLDGTLFRAETVTVPAVEGLFQERGLPPPTEEEICSFFGRPIAEFHAWLRARYELAPEDGLPDAIRQRELEMIAKTGKMYPGAREALETLRTSVGRMALCTNGRWDYVGRVLREQRLKAYFDVLRYHETEQDNKPDMVRELLERFESRPAIVVGDRRDDIEAAHRNGLAAIAALYGFGSAEELAEAEATAKAPSDLPALVAQLIDGR